jgi:hypothetical protein
MLSDSALSVANATRRLQRFRLPTAGEAHRILQSLLAQSQCLRLYQHYFPQEFVASAARVQPPGDRLSLREREFLKLVNERLFPLSEWYLDELRAEAGEDWFDLIPLCQINPIMYEDDDGLAWPIRAFMAMLTGAEEVWAEIKEQLGLDVPRPIAMDWSEFTLNWAGFTSLCEQAGELAAGVPTVIEVVGRDTGNFWLDFDDEMMASAGLSWTIETMDALAAEWQEAQPIIQRFNRALDWLQQNPEQLAQIVAFWNRSMEEKPGDTRHASR